MTHLPAKTSAKRAPPFWWAERKKRRGQDQDKTGKRTGSSFSLPNHLQSSTARGLPAEKEGEARRRQRAGRSGGHEGRNSSRGPSPSQKTAPHGSCQHTNGVETIARHSQKSGRELHPFTTPSTPNRSETAGTRRHSWPPTRRAWSARHVGDPDMSATPTCRGVGVSNSARGPHSSLHSSLHFLETSGVILEGEQAGRVRPASGEGGRISRRQGCLGRRMGPGTGLPPRSPPPRAPLAPLVPPSGITPQKHSSRQAGQGGAGRQAREGDMAADLKVRRPGPGRPPGAGTPPGPAPGAPGPGAAPPRGRGGGDLAGSPP